jgi:hypothetical protein
MWWLGGRPRRRGGVVGAPAVAPGAEHPALVFLLAWCVHRVLRRIVLRTAFLGDRCQACVRGTAL